MADAYATQLVAVDVGSGMIRVVPAPGKNVSDYLVTGLRRCGSDVTMNLLP